MPTMTRTATNQTAGPLGGIARKPQAWFTTGTQASGQFLHDLETHALLQILREKK
jgi:hypothetical protein